MGLWRRLREKWAGRPEQAESEARKALVAALQLEVDVLAHHFRALGATARRAQGFCEARVDALQATVDALEAGASWQECDQAGRRALELLAPVHRIVERLRSIEALMEQAAGGAADASEREA